MIILDENNIQNDSTNDDNADLKQNTLLDRVKEVLAITSDDELLNKNLSSKIETIKQYFINGGAKIEDDVPDIVVGAIAIGVNDLMNNKAGEAKFSPAFNILAKQIVSLKRGD